MSKRQAATPQTSVAYYGNGNVFPDFANICDNVTYHNGATFMHYMAYVDDDSMVLFTVGKKNITSNT